jgi:hypothetical protein
MDARKYRFPLVEWKVSAEPGQGELRLQYTSASQTSYWSCDVHDVEGV